MNLNLHKPTKFNIAHSRAVENGTVMEIWEGGSSWVMVWFRDRDQIKDLADQLIEYLANIDEAEEEAP